MIAPAAPLAQPNDPSPQDGSIQSGDPGVVVDFCLLLLSALAGPEPQPAADDDGVEFSATDTVSPADLPPELSGQMSPPPPILFLNNPAPQFLPVTGEGSSPQEGAQRFDAASPFVNGSTLESPLAVELPAQPESEEFDSASISSSGAFDLSASDESNAAGIPLPGFTAVTEATEQALSSFPAQGRSDSVCPENNTAENFASAREPVEKPRAPQLQSAENGPLRPDVAALHARAFTEGDSRERKNSESENRERQGQPPASGHAGGHSSHDPEIFAPPGLAVADRQVAAHVDQVALLPGERSGFFAARDDVRGGVNETEEVIKPGAQAPVTAQGGSLHGVEREASAKLQPTNAFASAIERVVAEISTHARDNRREVVIQLEPPELGGLKIDLALEGDRLQARIAVEVAETGALLQKHLPELRRMLQEQNLDLVNVQVDVHGGPAQGSQQESAGRQDRPAIATQIQTGDESPREAQRIEAAQRGAGAVSVWA